MEIGGRERTLRLVGEEVVDFGGGSVVRDDLESSGDSNERKKGDQEQADQYDVIRKVEEGDQDEGKTTDLSFWSWRTKRGRGEFKRIRLDEDLPLCATQVSLAGQLGTHHVKNEVLAL